MTVREAVLATLTGDADLMELLPGGLYDFAVTGEISRQNTPNAFDTNKELKACGLLRFESSAPLPINKPGARDFFVVMLYQFRGSGVMEEAREKIYALLHDKRALNGMWRMRWTDDVRDVRDGVLDVPMLVTRFQTWVAR